MALSVSLAPIGNADDPFIFGERNHMLICNLVGQEPTPRGIWAARSYLLSVDPGDLRYGQMLDAIGYAIGMYCPQYASIYQTYKTQFG